MHKSIFLNVKRFGVNSVEQSCLFSFLFCSLGENIGLNDTEEEILNFGTLYN